MRLTNVLHHAKYFWWGKGWGNKPRKNTDNFYYKMQWNAKRRRTLEVVDQKLPEGVIPIDPNVYLKQEFEKEIRQVEPFVFPWPYSKRPVKGTSEDPNYQTSTYVYQRQKRLVEPVKLPLYFTNTILEEGLPQQIQKRLDELQLDASFVEYCKRRVDWCLKNDASMRKLPLDRQFPYIDQRPPRVWGVTVNRKENNLLQSLYDLAKEWLTKKYGFNGDILLQRLSSPHCVLPFTRDNKNGVMDLECDFVTLLSPVKNELQINLVPFDTNYQANTSNKTLSSVHPLSWEIAFDSKHFFPTDYEFEIPSHSSIQTIFLSNNNVRRLSDDDFQGRSIMFCYGYAMQQANIALQNNSLQRPICIQCIYTSKQDDDFKIGFVLFQLNTLSVDDDTDVRNQVWLSKPKSVLDNLDGVITDMVTVQSNGLFV